MDVLDILLKAEVSLLPEQDYKLKRLSKACNTDVIFKLRALPYDVAADLIKSNKDDMEVHIMLAGVVEQNLKANELMQKYNAVTPAEVIKKMLLPGEITDISRVIEKLSGYRVNTIEEVKKK